MKKFIYFFGLVFTLMLLLSSCDLDLTTKKYNITVKNNATYGKIKEVIFWDLKGEYTLLTAPNLIEGADGSIDYILPGQSRFVALAESDKNYGYWITYENGDNVFADTIWGKKYTEDTIITVTPTNDTPPGPVKYNITVKNNTVYSRIKEVNFWDVDVYSVTTAPNLIKRVDDSIDYILPGESKVFTGLAEEGKNYGYWIFYENGDYISDSISYGKKYTQNTIINVDPKTFTSYTVTNKIGENNYFIDYIVFQPAGLYDKCYYYPETADFPYYTIYGLDENRELDTSKGLENNASAIISNREASIYDIYVFVWYEGYLSPAYPEGAYYTVAKKNVTLSSFSTLSWNVTKGEVVAGYIRGDNKIKLKNRVLLDK